MAYLHPSDPSPCMKTGCTKQATHNVAFALREHPEHPPAISSPILKVCDEHSDVKWDEVYSEEGWEQICRFLQGFGWQRPKVEFSYLEIYPIKPLPPRPPQFEDTELKPE